MNIPKRIDITHAQLDAILARAKKLLAPEDYEIIKGMADTIVFLSSIVGKKSAQVQKLLRLLFGKVNEKTRKVLKEKKDRQEAEKKEVKGHGRNGVDSSRLPHFFVKISSKLAQRGHYNFLIIKVLCFF